MKTRSSTRNTYKLTKQIRPCKNHKIIWWQKLISLKNKWQRFGKTRRNLTSPALPHNLSLPAPKTPLTANAKNGLWGISTTHHSSKAYSKYSHGKQVFAAPELWHIWQLIQHTARNWPGDKHRKYDWKNLCSVVLINVNLKIVKRTLLL